MEVIGVLGKPTVISHLEIVHSLLQGLYPPHSMYLEHSQILRKVKGMCTEQIHQSGTLNKSPKASLLKFLLKVPQSRNMLWLMETTL